MSSAREFVQSNPGLARVMASSDAFAAIREGAALEIDGVREFIVRGDTLGDEEDLFVETLVRGAQASDPNDPTRVVYEELDEQLREVVDQRVKA